MIDYNNKRLVKHLTTDKSFSSASLSANNINEIQIKTPLFCFPTYDTKIEINCIL